MVFDFHPTALQGIEMNAKQAEAQKETDFFSFPSLCFRMAVATTVTLGTLAAVSAIADKVAPLKPSADQPKAATVKLFAQVKTTHILHTSSRLRKDQKSAARGTMKSCALFSYEAAPVISRIDGLAALIRR